MTDPQTSAGDQDPILLAAADDIGPRMLVAVAGLLTVSLLLLLWLLAAWTGAAALRTRWPYLATLAAGTLATVTLAARARRREPQAWRVLAVHVSRSLAPAGTPPGGLARRLRGLEAGEGRGALTAYAAACGFEGHYGRVSTAEAFTKALEKLQTTEPAAYADLLGLRRLPDDVLRRLERDPVVTDAFHEVLRLQPWLARRLGWPEDRVAETFGSPALAARLARRRPRPEPDTSGGEVLGFLGRLHHSGKLVLGLAALGCGVLAWAEGFTAEHRAAVPGYLLASLVTLVLFPALTSPHLTIGKHAARLALLAFTAGIAAQLAIAGWALAAQLR